MIINDMSELSRLVEKLKKSGKKIVFTNGCFDLIHLGHISYLEDAKKFGDVLFVGVNSNQSVRKIKGNKRPIIDEKARAKLVDSLKPVDYVVIFNDILPNNIIEIIKPDVDVKGGDYTIDKMPEAKVVLKYGGRVEFIPLVGNYSTSKIIEMIVKRYGDEI